MENQNQLTDEEIVNPEQFQVGRNPHRDENDEQQGTSGTDEGGYTPGETAYADGEDTLLDQNSEELEVDQDTEDFEDPEDDEDVDGNDDDDLRVEEIDDEESIDESDDDDVDFENPVDDPA